MDKLRCVQQQDAGQKHHAKGKKAQKLHAIYMTFIPFICHFRKNQNCKDRIILSVTRGQDKGRD